jgi:hypothetical protein
VRSGAFAEAGCGRMAAAAEGWARRARQVRVRSRGMRWGCRRWWGDMMTFFWAVEGGREGM